MRALILIILALSSTSALAAFSSADGNVVSSSKMQPSANSTNPSNLNGTSVTSSGIVVEGATPQKSNMPASTSSGTPMSNSTVAR